MKFDLTDLKIFLSAVEGGSLTAAAAQNNVVVAAVSARLRRLETALNLELFERTGRGIRPTLAGDMLVRHARQIVGEARKAEIELNEFALGRSGHVRLMSNTNMLAEHMPHIVGTFLAEHPQINVTMRDRPSLEVVEMLRNGEADIGVVASSVDMTGLQRWRFLPDRLVVVAPQDWLMNERMAFSRVLDFPLVSLQEKAALSQFVRRSAHELGRKPQVRIRAEGFESICRMVEGGAGVGIVPLSAAVRYSSFMNFRVVDLDEAWAERELYVCVRSAAQLPGYAQKLLSHLIAYVEHRKVLDGEDSGQHTAGDAAQPILSEA